MTDIQIINAVQDKREVKYRNYQNESCEQECIGKKERQDLFKLDRKYQMMKEN
ncbi:MAG: hypothetical protein GKC53_04795 [Neisseriaceae bacterium]|nr:MAG: hypothetical protein GKC53_04795 [Neisseriaceae bacterium]